MEDASHSCLSHYLVLRSWSVSGKIRFVQVHLHFHFPRSLTLLATVLGLYLSPSLSLFPSVRAADLPAPGATTATPATTDESPAFPDRWADAVEPDSPFYSSVVDARSQAPGSSALPYPDNLDNLTPRGLVLNLGSGCWACFDVDLLRLSAVWHGQGLTPVSMSMGSYHVAGIKAPEGQAALPQPLGEIWLSNGLYPGVQAGAAFALKDPRPPCPDPKEVGKGPLPPSLGRFREVRLRSAPNSYSGVELVYEVGGVRILEHMSASGGEGANGPVVTRTFQIAPHAVPVWIALGSVAPAKEGGPRTQVELAPTPKPPAGIALQLVDNCHVLRVGPSTSTQSFSVLLKHRAPRSSSLISPLPAALPAPSAGASVSTRASRESRGDPHDRRWPQTCETRATRSSQSETNANASAFVVDNIPLPVENPWHRNIRIADIAFRPDGQAAVVTFDGDVWLVSGLEGALDRVRWNRFASGFHEPLSICTRGDEFFVGDRNGIWRLRDDDRNGEADVHELFSNAHSQTAETREFAAGLRAAPDGSFVVAKGGQQGTTVGRHNGSILRISPDGLRVTRLAHGMRQPFIGVHPVTGVVTASDQEGNYIPTTPLYLIWDDRDNKANAHADAFHGFLPLFLPKEKYPESIVEPMTWIPHPINPSGVSQVWLSGARMGPLNEALIHLGYYRPEIFLVLMNQRESRAQAAVISITRDFQFPLLAGAVNPADGQLYVAGFQIFGTVAPQLSGLARVRYTGAPSTLPTEAVPMDKGILLRFDVPLNPAVATDAANFSAERWNYRRSWDYGSPHFKLDGTKGQEAMAPSSSYLSKDGTSVFLGIPDMRPVMQMRLGWAIAAAEGTKLEQNAYFTPSTLSSFKPEAEGFEANTKVDLTPRAPTMSLLSEFTPSASEGRRVAELMGCVACHSADGTTIGKVGPTWKGLFGKERTFADGTRRLADEGYIRQSIREPSSQIVSGFEKNDTGMPSYEGILTEAHVEALVLYIKSLGLTP